MVVTPDDDLQLEKQADYRRITLSGNHYEMGQQWADMGVKPESEPPATEAAEAARILGLSLEQFGVLAVRGQTAEGQTLTPSQLSFALDCLQVVSNFHPALLDEFEGWADTLGVSMDAVLGTLSFGIEVRKPRCSVFAWQTGQGIIIGRNYDFFHWSRIRHLVRAEPVAYYATVGMNDGLPAGRYDGVNEQSLFVGLCSASSVVAKRSQPGVAFHLVPRILLETCADAGEAVMLAGEMPHLMSCIYLIADPQEMFVVEAYPGSVRVREATEGYVAATNHFLHPDMQSLVAAPLRERSERRLSKLASALQGVSDEKDPWQVVTDILTEHEAPVCNHADGLATLWSLVADMSGRRLAYSLGAPCRNQYEEIPWPGREQAVGTGHER